MTGADDTYTIIVFRGTRSNPLRLKLSKTLLRRSLIIGICLLVVQIGVVTHYVFQRSQLTELSGVRDELTNSRERTSTFAGEIEGMKKRMLTLQLLNRKLQTMFGIEPDDMEGLSYPIQGQGGEEFPYEGQSQGSAPMKGAALTNPVHTQQSSRSDSDQLIGNIENGLVWLTNLASNEQDILDGLSATATQRVKQLASTPSIWPVKGPVTSKFGPRVSPFTGKKALHAGIDIGVPKGTEIRAPAAGKVVVAAYDTRMGKFIRIHHGNGLETTYGHLSKLLVKYGQKVKRGDLIGLVGSTGKFSTGPHLHYQVAANDRVVDPLQYILD